MGKSGGVGGISSSVYSLLKGGAITLWMMMSVKCAGTFCKNCPELNVENDNSPMCAGGVELPYENYLYCKHYKKCEKLVDYIEKQQIKAKEKEEAANG